MSSQIEDPIQTLIREHELISRAVLAMRKVLAKDERTGQFSQDFYKRAFTFFAEFVEGVHHPKEERILFPELEQTGMPVQGGPIGWMLDEHEIGREQIEGGHKALADVARGDHESRGIFRKQALAFAKLTENHIKKENRILLQMAQRALSAETSEYVAKRFESADRAARELPHADSFAVLVEELESET